jgi:peptidoglycan/xylan/chitin deacetylase (PgdA/CDA1 family)
MERGAIQRGRRGSRRWFALSAALFVAVLLACFASSGCAGTESSAETVSTAPQAGSGLGTVASAGAPSVSTMPSPAVASTTTTTLGQPPLPSVLPVSAKPVRVPVLMYHYVDAVPVSGGPYADDLTVRTKAFEAEMRLLKTRGYHTVSLMDVYRALAGQKRLPGKPVVLTFDDGYEDNYTVAFPILRRYRLAGTFFIITRNVGKRGFMTWQQLREMRAQGMSIQSHTVSHPELPEVSTARLKTELAQSRDAIASNLGYVPRVLSYPSGKYDAKVEAEAATAGYRVAVTTHFGKRVDPAAIMAVPRVRIPAFMSLEGFAASVK